jgi:heptosyltransferase I
VSRPSLDRVGIVMLSAVGDAVHVLPVINALKRHQPSTHVTWLLQPGPATLVRGHPAVDEILEVDPRRAGGLLAARRQLAVRPFDLVLDLQVALKAGIVTTLTHAPVKLGFDRARARDLNWLFTTHRIPPHPRQHVQDQYFEFLRHLGVPTEPVEYGLGPWPDERAWQREFYARFDRPVAAIVAGTSNPDRDWRPERWAAVGDVLHERYGLRTVIVGGPTARERATADAVAARAAHPPEVALGTGLRKLVGILEGAALVLTPDTGPMHIAVALARPTIALMANADPRRTGPYRRYQDLIVDAFREPGDGDAVVWERRPGRTGRITVDEVLAKVALWHERYRDR